MRSKAQRRRAARILMVFWYLQVPIATALSLLAVFAHNPWTKVLVVYITVLSVETGIESVHARLNADLP